MRVTRRRLLGTGSAIAGASALGLGLPTSAFAARERATVRYERDIQNLDPAFRIGTVEGNILRACQPRLVAFKPGVLEWVPESAASITQVDDLTIDFTLKEGLMWQGGYGEVTAEDVKFSFERFNTPNAAGEKSTYAADWGTLKEVEVTGKYSGRIHLTQPSPALWVIALADISGCIVCKRAFEELGDKMNTTIVGAGPYMMAEWVPNQQIVLRADPNYQGEKPHFPEIVIKPIADFKTAELAFQADEVDFTAIEPTSAETMRGVAGTRVISKDSINYVWVGINVEKPPYDDIRVRRAIRKAIDVDEVVLAAYNGTVSRANALMAPGLTGHWDGAPANGRDVEGARALLAEAGFPDGFEARLTLLNRPSFQTAGLVIQAQLAEVGIRLDVEVLDGGTYWSMGEGEAGENLELSLQRFGGKADPSFQTQWFVSDQTGEWNWQRWKNEEYDRLNAEAAATLDQAKRAESYVRMQQLMEESEAFIWLTHEVNVFVTKDWLEPAILPNGDDWQYHFFKEV